MQTGSFKQKTTIREYPTPELVELGKTFKQKLRSPHARETCDGQEVLASQKWGNRGCHCSSSLVTQAAQPKAREGKSAPDGLTGASRTPGTGRQQVGVAECPALRVLAGAHFTNPGKTAPRRRKKWIYQRPQDCTGI